MKSGVLTRLYSVSLFHPLPFAVEQLAAIFSGFAQVEILVHGLDANKSGRRKHLASYLMQLATAIRFLVAVFYQSVPFLDKVADGDHLEPLTDRTSVFESLEFCCIWSVIRRSAYILFSTKLCRKNHFLQH